MLTHQTIGILILGVKSGRISRRIRWQGHCLNTSTCASSSVIPRLPEHELLLIPTYIEAGQEMSSQPSLHITANGLYLITQLSSPRKEKCG